MNMQDAAQEADKALDATFRAIYPEINWTHGPTTAGSCVVSRRRTVMTIISKERRGSFLGVVDRFWRKGGYRILAINDDDVYPAIYAKTDEGFDVSLSFGGSGQAFFRVDSPCVEKSEVVDSKSKPNTPSYEGMENIPRPNIHSDFWSATGAVGATEPANPATS
ncbi:hypothetical protein ACFYPN_26460 [Streptomyces sp. NPDC005576]|uniref:hypothetical protein n=1 Tax=Streptomyces sp. NPDC005576 TaxID=3364726 RepID=UPI003690DC9C